MLPDLPDLDGVDDDEDDGIALPSFVADHPVEAAALAQAGSIEDVVTAIDGLREAKAARAAAEDARRRQELHEFVAQETVLWARRRRASIRLRGRL